MCGDAVERGRWHDGIPVLTYGVSGGRGRVRVRLSWAWTTALSDGAVLVSPDSRCRDEMPECRAVGLDAAVPVRRDEGPHQGGPVMSSTTIVVTRPPPLFDESRLAVAGFLARYSGPTRVSYSSDLRQFFAWCARWTWASSS